ncbi:hypothetical protein AAFF_G00291020 [Aldrovandia affinis]|uniref:Uncharacterized protein n=1 Tax=Aldrovandia affinis TaxID=143900 RepID=A0AAD7R9N6_9TELE|nr:hypothetical protein AAFF_G00291020 [Aldrovandia affinis]
MNRRLTTALDRLHPDYMSDMHHKQECPARLHWARLFMQTQLCHCPWPACICAVLASIMALGLLIALLMCCLRTLLPPVFLVRMARYQHSGSSLFLGSKV